MLKLSARRLKSNHKNASIFKNRLEQLKEANTLDQDDPLIKILQGRAEDEELNRIYDQLPQKSFERKFNTEIQYSQLGEHINKHAKETALSKPWRGEESISDASLRMLTDSMKARSSKQSASNLGFTLSSKQGKALENVSRSKYSTKDRLEAVQDSIINYRLDKNSSVEQKEASQFRALYAEKFTPIGSFEKLRSVADMRIEESMKRGDFDSLQRLRGSAAKVAPPRPQIDRTEHHLNDILIRQKIVPPWIEKQSSVNRDVCEFRKTLEDQFARELIYVLDHSKAFESKSLNDFTNEDSWLSNKFEDIEDLKHFAFINWKKKQEGIIETKIKTLNSALRSYNLQAPLPTQKLYLVVQREFQKIYDATDIDQVFSAEKQKRLFRAASEQTSSQRSHYRVFDFSKLLKFW